MADSRRSAPDQVNFHLEIRGDEFLRFYRGEASSVQVIALDGRRVRFPAAALRPYVGRNGIAGDFRLCFDAQGRMLSLDRVAPSAGTGAEDPP